MTFGRELRLRPLAFRLDLRLRTQPLRFDFRLRLPALRLELRLRAFALRLEIALAALALQQQRLLDLAARVGGRLGGRLLRFHPHAHRFGDHGALDFRTRRRDFRLKPCRPLGAQRFHLRDPSLLRVGFRLRTRRRDFRLKPRRPLGAQRFHLRGPSLLRVGFRGGARVLDGFSRRLRHFNPDARQLAGHGPLDFRTHRRDLGLQPRGPLGALRFDLRRPSLLRVGIRGAARALERLLVVLRDGIELRIQLSLDSRPESVDRRAKLVLGHPLALSEAGSIKSSVENAANPSPTAT